MLAARQNLHTKEGKAKARELQRNGAGALVVLHSVHMTSEFPAIPGKHDDNSGQFGSDFLFLRAECIL